ncbi:DNA processing protein [Oikeobacillus pervagus]|uniref:DNA processing protein n=1 Tax=Oikeobacillus pervagus TaxID=1325931 RepID=A0AAJ1T1N9_9BACI|nr:DNA-processing protein DprA [Oikeobacillus pervagus]MDQ0214314.1 DNA processing protein [Oikeobacillus pervagus]
MDLITKKIIHLQHIKGMTWKRIYLLLKQDPSLQSLYQLPPSKLQHLLKISPTLASNLYHQLQSTNIDLFLEEYSKKQIDFIPIYDENYPALLKTIHQPPWGLYCMGDKKLLKNNKNLAIVGSRRGNEYGKKAIHFIVQRLVHHHFQIVSGLAKGIDTFAHNATIMNKGKTIAVIGGGFYHLYPTENRQLAKKITEEHVLISEYAPIMKPEKWHFPARNRIISGLSVGTILVQAGEKSGSLITANHALEQGRDVFVLPGSIFDPLSKGGHQLINEGATLVPSIDDLLEQLY